METITRLYRMPAIDDDKIEQIIKMFTGPDDDEWALHADISFEYVIALHRVWAQGIIANNVAITAIEHIAPDVLSFVTHGGFDEFDGGGLPEHFDLADVVGLAKYVEAM